MSRVLRIAENLNSESGYGSRESQLTHLANKRGALQSEPSGGPARPSHNPVCLAKSFQNVARFRLAQSNGRLIDSQRHFQIFQRSTQDRTGRSKGVPTSPPLSAKSHRLTRKLV